MLKWCGRCDQQNNFCIYRVIPLFSHYLVLRVGSKIDRFVVFKAMGGSEVALLMRSFVTYRLSNLASPTSQITVFMKLEERDRVASYFENISALPGISSFYS